MPRPTKIAKKTKSHSHSSHQPLSLKERFILRKKALLNRPKRRQSKHKSLFTKIIDSLYKGLSHIIFFISWSISWILSFALWIWLITLLWNEFGIYIKTHIFPLLPASFINFIESFHL
ncbi:hypothetical protein OQH61_03310 [Helicobacter sp. MIT 21-1697]|uniref:hypothetical protein n=1 Tax=Helicobacter sp. MIT 21-1697 TaxID=2993733 RepID=UPI00224B0572|nr:hypothetical protein [Helicobacter sp. MIT 21-1697]MCX2716761.1 hypothetical protein [Helicobacter sp. MIT 21-1697]